MTTNPNVQGTAPEVLCYNALVGLGLIPDVDFAFQAGILGGRSVKGGQVVDFLFANPPNLGISILGEYFHYKLHGGSRATDIMNAQNLLLLGIIVIHIDEDDLIADADSVVRDALNFRDRSKLSRGL